MALNRFLNWMLGIFAILLFLALSAYVLQNFADTRAKGGPTYLVTNESVAGVTNITQNSGNYFILAQRWVKSIGTVIACNGTNITGIPLTGCGVLSAANYTTAVDDKSGIGYIAAANGAYPYYNGTNWNVSYTVYDLNESQYKIPIAATSGLGKLTDYIAILILLGIFMIVISVFLGRRGGDELGGGRGDGPDFDVADGNLSISRGRGGDGGSSGSVRY